MRGGIEFQVGQPTDWISILVAAINPLHEPERFAVLDDRDAQYALIPQRSRRADTPPRPNSGMTVTSPTRPSGFHAMTGIILAQVKQYGLVTERDGCRQDR